MNQGRGMHLAGAPSGRPGSLLPEPRDRRARWAGWPARRQRLGSTRLRLLATLVVVLTIAGLLVSQATWSAFSGTTGNAPNT